MPVPALQQAESISEFGQAIRHRWRPAPIGCVALALSLLEAICTLFIALSKVGILVTFTSFLSTVIVSRYHANGVRIPTLGIAFVASTLNLMVVWKRRRSRALPSAAWRKRTLTVYQRWRERLLIFAGSLTIIAVIAEFWIHPLHWR